MLWLVTHNVSVSKHYNPNTRALLTESSAYNKLISEAEPNRKTLATQQFYVTTLRPQSKVFEKKGTKYVSKIFICSEELRELFT
jgi:hypothetical protein